jgi:hypothetical protein
MKKTFALLLGIIFSIVVLHSQVAPPQAFSYKASFTGKNGKPLDNTTISLRFSILQNDINGFVVYAETNKPTTNVYGQVDLIIGRGTAETGIFSSIDWSSDDFYLRTEVDLKGGTNYQLLSVSQLLSVPYAMYAGAAGSAIDAVTVAGNQTITGIKAFSHDLLVNGVTVGMGKNSAAYNTAIGAQSLFSNTTGQNNTAVGNSALYNNQNGTNNTAIGNSALGYNTSGSGNTANGEIALLSNQTGSGNTALGYVALRSNKIGNFNTAIGAAALQNNTDGTDNTAIGNIALGSITTGSYNTAVGPVSGHNNATGNNNVFLGSYAGYYETGSNKLFIDNQQRKDESDARNKALIYGVFDTDPAEQVLTVNGNVGIGTITPISKLDVIGKINVNSNNIINVANPINDQDAATKAYVDAAKGGATPHSIGESYGCGIVFFVYDNGQHGLIAAPIDQSTGIQWYNGIDKYTGTKGDGLGAGAMNTAIIVSTQINDNQTGNFAAKVCADYSATMNEIIYGDWYLPSLFELNLLYQRKDVVGGFTDAFYWSSTEDYSNLSWGVSFSDGFWLGPAKYFSGRVRAIRAF